MVIESQASRSGLPLGGLLTLWEIRPVSASSEAGLLSYFSFRLLGEVVDLPLSLNDVGHS